ncbi:MAG: lipid-binding SYLF domain-containing protein [Aquificaceae bacterium]|uniref:lipid-binding SYLF domain-containing protein n=1 Tax=Hydrogenobacter sp. Uz 6-8 TaxID=3384828 RepID=UPI0030B7175F
MKSLLLFLLIITLSFGTTKEDMDKLLEDSVAMLKELGKSKEDIPSDLLRRARGVVICPSMLRGAFIVGAGAGNCVVSYKDPKTGEWSAPAFYTLAQASIGFQLGVESVDLLLVIGTDRGMKSLLRNKVKLGADVSVAAGPVGRGASAGTDIALKADIYSYSRARGVFAGVSLQGAVLSFNSEGIRAYYGETLSPKEILFGKVRRPESAIRLSRTLTEIASGRD